jgi:hypothetical protein
VCMSACVSYHTMIPLRKTRVTVVSTSVGPRDLVVRKTTTIPYNFKNLISDCRLLVGVVVLLGIVTHNKQQCKS